MPGPAVDYIGPDPVAWVRRLEDVNAGSSFTAAQKEVIADGLLLIRTRLVNVEMSLRLRSAS